MAIPIKARLIVQKRTLNPVLAVSFVIFAVQKSEAAPPKSLSLKEATQILLEQNPELKAMEKNEATQAKIHQTKG